MKRIKKLLIVGLITGTLSVQLWAQGTMPALEETEMTFGTAIVNPELEKLLAKGANPQVSRSARLLSYMIILDYHVYDRAYQEYIQPALEGLLAIGEDVQATIGERSKAYDGIILYGYKYENQADKRYVFSALEGNLALAKDMPADSTRRLFIYENILKYYWGNPSYESYVLQAFDGLLVWGEDTKADIFWRKVAYRLIIERCQVDSPYQSYFDQAFLEFSELGRLHDEIKYWFSHWYSFPVDVLINCGFLSRLLPLMTRDQKVELLQILVTEDAFAHTIEEFEALSGISRSEIAH